jgi:surface carbohydrate biosynthesis protein
MKLNSNIPAVLFSVEIGARELDSKLVIASAVAARGCRAIVGHKGAIALIGRSSQRVAWQGKSLFSVKSHDHLADRLLENNSSIMFMPDEGAMHQVKAWEQLVLLKHQLDQLHRRRIGRVCVWGQRQKEVLSAHAETLRDVVVVTGSPRFDICLPEYSWLTTTKSEEISAKYSPYILACTRFTAVAHSEGLHDSFSRKFDPRIQSKRVGDFADIWFAKWQQDVHDFADLVFFIKEVAVHFPQYTVVVRPHPSESLTFYRSAFSSFKNVVVSRDGSVLPWIRSAELVIHSNCTTGVEAVLAGRPVINLLPGCARRSEFDVEVAREAGHVVGSVKDALERVERLLSGEAVAHEWSGHAKAILNNLTLPAVPLVVDETVSVLREEGITSSQITLPPSKRLRDGVKRLLRAAQTSYADSKRGLLSAEHVEGIIDGYRSKHSGAGGRVRHMTSTYVVVDPA